MQEGKQILLDVLHHKGKQKRVPWVPFAGVHAGSLAGYLANDMLTDKDKLVESVLKAYEIYKPDGLPVVFDLQLEAEAMGCDLFWDDCGKVPPTVRFHPLEMEKYVPCTCKIPTKEDGRFPIILQAMEEVKNKIGDNVALYGLICGPFTLASHLRGQMLFMDMYDDEDYVLKLMAFCTKVCQRVSDMYRQAGMDVIGFVDPLLSQISSDHVEVFVQQFYIELFEDLRKSNTPSCLFVCGDVTHNIDVLCQMKPDCLSVDENVDIGKANEICKQYGVVIGGNIQLTVTMLHGTSQDNMKAVIDIIDACHSENIIVSPGCDMPYDVPKENGIACYEAIHDYENIKEALKDYNSDLDVSNIEVHIPDYAFLKKPLVEVFTLDSRTCAACTYTMNTIKVAYQTSNEFDYIEYRFCDLEGIAQIKAMHVKHLPSIYINGQLAWSSLIPTVDELIEKIRDI
ncbi:MAG: uroporphyrinogen decarboxylase [Holdemanella sp.]|nr:uroporphyrinogen decarboxylase [Holdemanella sp.]